jgi:hypothetical protein
MQAYQERVIAEKVELDRRREALRRFTGSDEYRKLPYEERNTMEIQLEVMDKYSYLLAERIAVFD